MATKSKEELIEYVFRSLEVMTSHELPSDETPPADLPEQSVCSELLKSTDEVREFYKHLKNQH
ncbi:MAG: hypothetical protein CMF48_06140 [Legionellales bacterium]|nr:hypothetical protein [Legionellales bacterium]